MRRLPIWRRSSVEIYRSLPTPESFISWYGWAPSRSLPDMAFLDGGQRSHRRLHDLVGCSRRRGDAGLGHHLVPRPRASEQGLVPRRRSKKLLMTMDAIAFPKFMPSRPGWRFPDTQVLHEITLVTSTTRSTALMTAAPDRPESSIGGRCPAAHCRSRIPRESSVTKPALARGRVSSLTIREGSGWAVAASSFVTDDSGGFGVGGGPFASLRCQAQRVRERSERRNLACSRGALRRLGG